MTQCYKVFKRVDGVLTSLYYANPLQYYPNEVTHATGNSKLFCYRLLDTIDEYSDDREVWLCECDTIIEGRGNFLLYSHSRPNEAQLSEFWNDKDYGDCKYVTKWVKPIKEVKVRYVGFATEGYYRVYR